MGEEKTEIELVFDALGDPTRRALVELLRAEPQQASKLAGPLGITLTAVGQHLEILEECGLVATEKVGRVRTCRMANRGLDNLEWWVRSHRTEWERRMDVIGLMLAEEDTGKPGT